jgi:hypothetical protein
VLLPVLESNGRHSLAAECPSCSHLMPGASGIVPEVVVPIVGGPKAGKTAYLASLMLELDDRTQAGASRLSVVESSRAAFEQMAGNLRAGRVPTKTLDRELTPAFVAEVRSGSSQSALLYAHDVAGERFQQADAVRGMGSLTRARGALVLIDPFSLQVVSSTLEGQDERRALIDPSAESPQSVIERFLQALRESGRTDIKKLPVAVVLSKADALTGDSGLAPGEHGEAVSRWLEANGGGNLVRLLQGEFDHLEFFAVSALGRLPDPGATTQFTPKGTLEPFFWLLRANKIAMHEAASTTETVTEQLQAKEGARRVAPWPRIPILAPRPKTGGGYVAGIAASLAIFGGIIGLVAVLANHNTPTAYANAADLNNTGNTGTGNSGTGNTGTGNSGTGNSGTGNTGTGNTGTGNTGTGNTGTGNTGTGTGNTPADASAVVSDLHSYAAAYTDHSTQALSTIMAPNVQRRGLTASGCTVDHGRRAVLSAYESQFNEGTGPYTLVGLSQGDVQFGSHQTATVKATYRITPGGTGSVSFTLSRTSGSWLIIKIQATCA